MDREIIERLAMDSAAGELNEDVEALLQDYLSEHKEKKLWFLEMLETFRKTQDAFEVKTDLIKRQAEKKIPRKFNWSPVMRWAAVIIISACIGAAAGRWIKPETTQQKPNVLVTDTSSAKRTSFNLDNLDDGFWRNKIKAIINSSPAGIHMEKSSGKSLLEQYRQYLKERNHE